MRIRHSKTALNAYQLRNSGQNEPSGPAATLRGYQQSTRQRDVSEA